MSSASSFALVPCVGSLLGSLSTYTWIRRTATVPVSYGRMATHCVAGAVGGAAATTAGFGGFAVSMLACAASAGELVGPAGIGACTLVTAAAPATITGAYMKLVIAPQIAPPDADEETRQKNATPFWQRTLEPRR